MARRTRGASLNRAAVAQVQQGHKSRRSKRVKAQKGDIVMLGGRMHMHNFGTLVRVLAVLDKERLLCEVFAAGDEDYNGNQIVVFTREPKGQTAQGSNKADYLAWGKSVINVRERVVTKIVEVKPKQVVTSHEELQTVLTDGGLDGHEVVVQLPQVAP